MYIDRYLYIFKKQCTSGTVR